MSPIRTSTGTRLALVHGVVLSLLCGSEGSKQTGTSIRGLDPNLLPSYDLSSGKFKCLGTGRVIPAERVNDNYCDCLDGSDEPGTSACPYGHFYCRNRGHEPRTLNASFVDDGFCDCCDGSDEASGKCANTCKEAGAAKRSALKQKSETFRQGLRNKDRYISSAVSSKQKWEKEVAQLRLDEAKLQKEVDDLKRTKEQIEKVEAKEREAEERRKKEEAEKAAAEKPAETPPETGDDKAGADIDTAHGKTAEERLEELDQQLLGSKPTSISELQAHEEAKGASDFEENQAKADEYLASVTNMGKGDEEAGQSAAEEAGQEADAEAERQLSVEEEGRRIAAQWTQDPEAAGRAQETEQEQKAEETAGAQSEVSGAEEATHDDAQPVDLPAKGLWSKVSGLLSYTPWSGVTSTEKERQAVKDAFNTKNNRLSELTRQKQDLETKLGQNFGPQDIFIALADQCFSANIEKYVYEICPFKTAAQKDGGMSTSLGTWSGFENNFSTMKFQHGQHCWNGPQRSMQVELECGTKEELSHVEEPNRCEYHAKLKTPAVCSTQDYAVVQKQVQDIESEILEKSEL